jgi:hypothetical protein
MRKELLNELVERDKQAVVIERSQSRPSRKFVVYKGKR